MNIMLGRVGVNVGGSIGRNVRTHVSWQGISKYINEMGGG